MEWEADRSKLPRVPIAVPLGVATMSTMLLTFVPQLSIGILSSIGVCSLC